MIEILEDNALIRFFGVYDGHGDFGREVLTSIFIVTLGISVGECGIRALHKDKHQEDLEVERLKRLQREGQKDVQVDVHGDAEEVRKKCNTLSSIDHCCMYRKRCIGRVAQRRCVCCK